MTYRRTGSGTYSRDDFPTQLVYGPAAGPVLRLITCGGVCDRDAGSHRGRVGAFTDASEHVGPMFGAPSAVRRRGC